MGQAEALARSEILGRRADFHLWTIGLALQKGQALNTTFKDSEAPIVEEETGDGG